MGCTASLLSAELARDMNLIIRPPKSTLSTCSGQQMTVEGCTWLTATANNVAIRAKFFVAKGRTEQLLLGCDDLINLLIVHKEFPNRTVTCSSCTEVGRQEKAYTGRREEQKKGRPKTLHKIQKRAGNTDAETRRKSKPDTWTAMRNEAHMCRKTKAGHKEELINEFQRHSMTN